MNRNRIIDKAIEVAIGIGITATVSVLSGLRKDISKLNDTMIMVVERLASNETSLSELKVELKSASKDLETRVRVLEIKFSQTEGRGRK